MKIQKTFLYEKEVMDHAKTNPFIKSFAEWACEEYRKQFLSLNTKLRQLQTLKSKEVYLLKEIERMQKSKPKQVLSKKEKTAIKGMKQRIIKFSLEGCYNSYINETKSNINRKQFKLLVDKHGT